MKPEDLISPFSWQERRALLHDHILYVPPRCEDYTSFRFCGWDQPEMFKFPQPVCIEYCSGNGHWIVDQALELPHCNWVAVERKFERVRKIWSKLKNRQLNNLLIVCGEGEFVTRQYFPSNTVEQVFVNFPDPWPKSRHAKNRLINSRFIGEVQRILTDRGKLTLVTDDPAYSQQMVEVATSVEELTPVFPYPHYSIDYPGYGSSCFEQLWREKGKMIRYHVFHKHHV